MNYLDYLKLSPDEFKLKLQDPKDPLCRAVQAIRFPDKKWNHDWELVDWDRAGFQLRNSRRVYQCFKCKKKEIVFGVNIPKSTCPYPDPIDDAVGDLAFELKDLFIKKFGVLRWRRLVNAYTPMSPQSWIIRICYIFEDDKNTG